MLWMNWNETAPVWFLDMDINLKKQIALGTLLGVVAVGLVACGEPMSQSTRGGVKAGHVIALGGGSAGAANACIACHGMKGEGDGETVPYLAAMDQGYLHRQLDDYASGRRQHTAMSAIAKRLLPHERESVSAYYQQVALPIEDTKRPTPNRLYHQGDAVRSLLACASCHGQNGEGLGSANPPLAQQPAKFLEAQMQSWKRGDRQNDPEHVMLLISQLLTDREIADLSSYLSMLPRARQSQALVTFPPKHRGYPRNDVSAQHQHGQE